MTSGREGRHSSGWRVRERNEGETVERGLKGQTGGLGKESGGQQSLFFFTAYFSKTGLSVPLLVIAFTFLIICCFGYILLHDKLCPNFR